MAAEPQATPERVSAGAAAAAVDTRALREAFDARASSYALWPELAAGETRHRVLERLEPVADETLLDLASGPGAMARAAGLEARRAGRLVPPRAAADAHALPFRDASFDLVACRHAARLFASPERVAAEIHRVLRRGGRMALCDVMAAGEPDADRVLRLLEELLAPCPVTLLAPEGWERVLAAAGFRVDWHDQPIAESEAGRSLLEACARSGASQAAFERARRLLLAAPAGTRRTLGVLAHGADVVFHPPFGIVGATRVA